VNLEQLRILLVDPSARGYHVGGRLVDECISFARRAEYERMRPWTKNPLAAARKIYVAREFKLVAEDAHQSFGDELIGQVYELDLRRCWPEKAQGPCRPQA
jgi:GNAT superfamily N-acetyltransferase